jgi:hypothetical protein
MLMPPTSLSRIFNTLSQTFENDKHEIFDIGMMAPQGPSHVALKTKEYVQKRLDAEAFDEVVFVGESWGADIGMIVSEHLAHNSIAIAGEPSEAGFHSEDEEWRARANEIWLRFSPHYKNIGPIAMKAMDNNWGWLGPQETWKRINNLHTLEKRVVIIAGFGGQQPGVETILKTNDFYALRAKSNFQCFNLPGGGHRVLNREASKVAGLTLAILNPGGNARPDNPRP